MAPDAASGSADRLIVVAFLVTLVAAVAVAYVPAKLPSNPTSTGINSVGSIDYEGQRTALGLQSECRVAPPPETYNECVTRELKLLLLAEGAIRSFDLLDNLTRIDTQINRDSHPIAHDLGRYAFQAYGDIHLALSNCSYKVFQGCLHGAQQSYFDTLPAGIDEDVVRTTCPPPRSAFEEYACLHGLGHGLMLNTNYNMNGSLQMCDALGTYFAEASCWGGVFMENLVGWIDSKSPTAAGGHDHGHVGPPPVFMVDESKPSYPCNVMAERYADSCWQLQTSFILRFNGGNFLMAARECDAAGQFSDTCYRSLGRDAGPYAERDPIRGASYCANGTERGRALCIRGFISEGIHNDADPYVGSRQCPQFTEIDRAPCFDETAGVSRNFMPDVKDRAKLCTSFPADYQAECRRAAAV